MCLLSCSPPVYLTWFQYCDWIHTQHLYFAFLTSVNTVEESKGEVGVLKASSTPDTPVSAATETGKKKRKSTLVYLTVFFNFHPTETEIGVSS